MGDIMRKMTSWVAVLGSLALLSLGCGIADDDFEAGNKLRILLITDEEGSDSPIFFAVEWTDDSGRDGDPNTGDEGENDGFPDEGELLIEGLSSDLGTMTLANEARLGVDPGVSLEVFQINTTYLDATGELLVIPGLPTTFEQSVQVVIPTDSTVDVDFILLPQEVKTARGGLREIFLFGDDQEKQAVERLTAIIDVFARDRENSDNVHDQAAITFDLINPTESPPE